MNSVTLSGRLTRDPEVRESQSGIKTARYTLAIDRPRREGQEQSADFVSIVAFDKRAEFAEKYLQKGMKIIVQGRIQTGSYKNRDGQTVYTTDIIVSEHEFCEAKRTGEAQKPDDGFMQVPDSVDDAGLPFN